MRVSISIEQRFLRSPDGAIWTQTVFPYSFWQRYLEVFDEVHVIARALNISQVPTDYRRVDGPHVTFTVLPHYLGPLQFMQNYSIITKLIEESIRSDDAIIMRVGSILAQIISEKLISEKHPYGLEVVGDPAEAFSKGANTHPLRPFFRLMFTMQLKRQCQHAAGVAYVTERSLQRRYPVKKPSFQTNYSSIDLNSITANLTSPLSVNVSDVELHHNDSGTRTKPSTSDGYKLIFVGSFEQMYKAPDILLKAVARCAAQGLKLHLSMVGDGRYRTDMEELAAKLKITHLVDFLGQVAHAKVKELMSETHLFVMPSRTEGLPRAMIEAMSVGLACIGTNVGGIPELLQDDVLVEPNNVKELAEKITEVLGNPERLAMIETRNRKFVSEHFNPEELNQRRTYFYQYIKKVTGQYLARR